MRKDPRVAIARNLVRIYSEVLEEPAPLPLLDLLRRLEACEAARCLGEVGTGLEAVQVWRGRFGPDLRGQLQHQANSIL